MAVFETWLDNYCDVILKVGANLQPGQPLVIGAGPEMFLAPIEARPFVHRLASRAYEYGASNVEVHWFDPVMARLQKEKGSIEKLIDQDGWKLDRFMQPLAKDAAFVMLYSPDANLYQGISPERVGKILKAESAAVHPFRQLYGKMEISWVIGAVVTAAWARTVFPDIAEDEASNKLWELIIKAVRADQPDPVAAWTRHLSSLQERQRYMDEMQFAELRYTGPGTQLTVGLPRNQKWISGATTKDRHGKPFVPNVPTEEIFMTPDRSKTNGVVRSTMPLSYNGRLIRDLTFRFENGKIVEATADLPQDELAAVLGLDADEGARYLGEVALVPQESPIAQMDTLFYNTLFDENSSCHLAFGNGFPIAVEGGATMDKSELAARGINESTIHVDFMIGSSELDIDGVTSSGDVVPLFRKGNWAV